MNLIAAGYESNYFAVHRHNMAEMGGRGRQSGRGRTAGWQAQLKTQ